MQNHEDKIKLFDEFFVQEYDYLRGFTKSIDPYCEYQDILHECYCKCRDRISKVGFSGKTFLNFTRVTIINTFKSGYRFKQKHKRIHYDDINYTAHIEETLAHRQDMEEKDHQLEQHQSYLNTMVFSYIDERFSKREVFVFKTYFLLKHKKMNYKQLSLTTGYSTGTVSGIIKRMKSDIRLNLEDYVYGRTFTGNTELVT